MKYIFTNYINLFSIFYTTVAFNALIKPTFNHTFMALTLIDEPYLFLGLSSIDEPNILFSILVPIMIYNNADSDKSSILSDNKGKAGIYRWTHKESGKIYIGSAFDLSERISQYFSLSKLNKWENYIARALISHTHSAFSLSILEYIDVSNLSKEEARSLILSREQFYLDLIFSADELNTYNILKVAGSSLGYRHTDESLAKMSEAQKSIDRTGENHPMFGKTHTAQTLDKMREAQTGENNPRGMLGKTHSSETIEKMRKVKIGEKHPMFGRTHSAESIAKMCKKVFVYSLDSESKISIFYKEFPSCGDAALYFDCTIRSISNYLDKNKLFKKQWILSSSLITKKE